MSLFLGLLILSERPFGSSILIWKVGEEWGGKRSFLS